MSQAALIIMENNTHICYPNHLIMVAALWSQNTHISIYHHAVDIYQHLTASIWKKLSVMGHITQHISLM